MKRGKRKKRNEAFVRVKEWLSKGWVWLKGKVASFRFPSRTTCLSIISALAQLGTLFATIIAFYALHETRLQRESIYKPELFIGDVSYYVDLSEKKKVYRVDNDSLVLTDMPGYKLINIGMGSALNVHTRMWFDINTVSNYYSEKGIKCQHSERKGGYLDTLFLPTDTLVFFKTSVLNNDKVDYVLPVNQSKEGSFQYFIPIFFDLIIKAHLHALELNKSDDHSSISFPIELYYQDINGKAYRKSLQMSTICSKSKKENMLFCRFSFGLSMERFVEELNEVYLLPH